MACWMTMMMAWQMWMISEWWSRGFPSLPPPRASCAYGGLILCVSVCVRCIGYRSIWIVGISESLSDGNPYWFVIRSFHSRRDAFVLYSPVGSDTSASTCVRSFVVPLSTIDLDAIVGPLDLVAVLDFPPTDFWLLIVYYLSIYPYYFTTNYTNIRKEE